MKKNKLLAMAALLGLSAAASAQTVNVICSVQAEWCSVISTVYARTTGVRINMALKGSGEALAQLIAEKDNPKTDVWFGGTGDPIRRAALMHERLMAAGYYGMSFLGERQRHFAAHFAGRRVDHLVPEFEHNGRTPVLRRSLAAVTASVVDTAACGDHTLFVGAIQSMTLGTDDPPVLFYAARYGQLARSAALESITPPGFW